MFKGQTLKNMSFSDELFRRHRKIKRDTGRKREYTIAPHEQYFPNRIRFKPGRGCSGRVHGEAGYMRTFVEDGQWDDRPGTVPAIWKAVRTLRRRGGPDPGGGPGVSWQAAPGGWFYNRTLAKEYFGSDDPAFVGTLIADWDAFLAAARELKRRSDGKVFMISSISDLISPFYAIRTHPWVEDDRFVFDPALLPAIELAKTLRDEGLDARAVEWTPSWYEGMKKKGNVFLYILPTWGLHYILKTNAPDAAGQWGLAAGPVSYFRGGTWMGVYAKSEKKELAWELSDAALNRTLTGWAHETGDFLAIRGGGGHKTTSATVPGRQNH